MEISCNLSDLIDETCNNSKKLIIKCEEDEAHPHCPHGPTLLFYNSGQGPRISYYACAAHRDKHSCNFHLPSQDLTEKKLQHRYKVPVQEYRELRLKLLHSSKLTPHSIHYNYCFSCNMPLLSSELAIHKGHEIMRNLPQESVNRPTYFLRALNNDRVQAQYFFDENALKFFTSCFQTLNINKIVCIGAPRLHEHLCTQPKLNIQSFLLDFDYRFYYFYEDKQYAWYNMCNNHFFDELQKNEFIKFMKIENTDGSILLFTDPPFGCRTEPIAHTLRQLTRLHNRLNELSRRPLPIFWVFPYFAEHYVRQQMPELEMCDYKVNYTNHFAYTNIGVKGRKLGSPVRVYTNVPLELLPLPIAEGAYKYCAPCGRYTALENRHCAKCRLCPSKNGATYRHCVLCGRCVKPTYVHCPNCRRCTQMEGHVCAAYQAQQRCWICQRMGHIETQCEKWRKRRNRKISFNSCENVRSKEIVCLLCERRGHNERVCKRRAEYLQECSFLSETQITFKM